MHQTLRTPSPAARARALVALARPRQWIKNGFVLAPLIFTGTFADPSMLGKALVAVLLFSLASSAVYIVNDLRDIEADRRHPTKARTRPLAAGTVPVAAAYGLLAVLYAALAAGWLAMPGVVTVIAGYVVLNLAYSFALKHQPVIDLFVIATGFVLRVHAGAVAIDVPVSSWMFVTTLCLALYLAAVKRRQELVHSGAEARTVLRGYTVPLIDRYAEMAATGALVFYAMFVMAARPELVVTIPLVMFCLFRYWYVVEALDGGELPTDVVLADWQLGAGIGLWVAACAWALWPSAAP